MGFNPSEGKSWYLGAKGRGAGPLSTEFQIVQCSFMFPLPLLLQNPLMVIAFERIHIGKVKAVSAYRKSIKHQV